MRRLFRPGVIVLAIGAIFFLGKLASAQCSVPELVKGADIYNELVCKASNASRRGDDRKALELLLAASEQPVLESPNTRLFPKIAKTYRQTRSFSGG